MNDTADLSLRREIEAADDERFEAKAAFDWPALSRLLGDELVYVHANGRMDSKESLLASLGTRRVHYRGAERRDTTVRRYGGLALMSGRIALAFEMGGERRSSESAFLSAWAWRDGRWQMVHWHSTAIAAVPAGAVPSGTGSTPA
jgi:hypothetical protein